MISKYNFGTKINLAAIIAAVLISLLMNPTKAEDQFDQQLRVQIEGHQNDEALEYVSQPQTPECQFDSDCNSYPFEVCSSKGFCRHKDVFPILGMEFVGLFLLIVIMSLSTMAGIGGGGIVIPFCMTFFGFQTKNAIALSGFTILACSITRYIVSLNEKHPEKNAVIIDYGLATIMLPIVMMGSMTGVLINIMFPNLMLTACLTFVLSFLTFQAAFKARSIYKKESIKILQKKKEMQKLALDEQEEERHHFNRFQESQKSDISQQEEIVLEDLQQPHIKKMDHQFQKKYHLNHSLSLFDKFDYEEKVQQGILRNYLMDYEYKHSYNMRKNNILDFGLSAKKGPSKKSESAISEATVQLGGTLKEQQQLNEILMKERTHKQWSRHLVCLTCLLGMVLVNLIRGSKNFQSVIGLQRCSGADWSILISFLFICGTLSFSSIRKVVYEQSLKQKVGYGFASSDIKLTKTAIFNLVLFAFLGGWVSGALGLGGGAIFNPLLLSMGVPPSVSSATGMYMILFSTSGSSIIYIMYGMLNAQFSFWIGFWCSLGSLVGLYLLNKVIKKYDRQSPVVVLLSFILGLSAILVPIFGSMDMRAQAERGVDLMKFNSIC